MIRNSDTFEEEPNLIEMKLTNFFKQKILKKSEDDVNDKISANK